jgi:hypothetical protein
MQPTAQAVGRKWETNEPQRGERSIARKSLQFGGKPSARRQTQLYFIILYEIIGIFLEYHIGKSKPAIFG